MPPSTGQPSLLRKYLDQNDDDEKDLMVFVFCMIRSEIQLPKKVHATWFQLGSWGRGQVILILEVKIEKYLNARKLMAVLTSIWKI